MTPSALPALGAPARVLSAPVARRRKVRPWRMLRRRTAWLLLVGWVVLPLLPVFGIGLSMMSGVGLF